MSKKVMVGLTMLAVLTLGSIGSVSTGQTDSRAPQERPATKPILTLPAALRALEAARAAADSLQAGGAVAIVDDGGHLLALTRPEGTFPAAAEVAFAKARTAAMFRKKTRDFEEAIRNGRVSLTAVGPLTPLEGGVPIVIDGHVVGAVGVSGAHSSDEDVRIAEAGAAAVQSAVHE